VVPALLVSAVAATEAGPVRFLAMLSARLGALMLAAILLPCLRAMILRP
jgi:hypothetical protein